VQGESVMLEEYARKMIFEEEQHLGEVDKMLRQPGDIHSVASPEAAAIVPRRKSRQPAPPQDSAASADVHGSLRALCEGRRPVSPTRQDAGVLGGLRRRKYEFCGSKFARCLRSPNHLEREPVTARPG
jgi:hypothetical protein